MMLQCVTFTLGKNQYLYEIFIFTLRLAELFKELLASVF